MKFDKILWLDTETFSLDPKVASIRELSYVAECDGKQLSDIQSFKVQPILHYEDMLFGHMGIKEFVADYNKKFHPQDPDRLVTFGFQEPLFVYSKAALTFNLPPPKIINPQDWLIGTDLTSAKKALLALMEYIFKFDTQTTGRWVLAGHNIKYDFDVLTSWTQRLLGEDEAKVLLNKFNRYVFLDTLALSRWMQYSKRLTAERANLESVAAELDIDVSNIHTASFDVFASKEIARILLGLDT